MAKKKKTEKHGDTIAVNKKASFQFHLLERFEAGLVLMGSEVKALRAKKASLADSYVTLKRGEAYLIHAHITPYEYAHQINHEPRRERKLLLHKEELKKIGINMREKGLTLVPTRLYFNDRGKAKIEIALAKGKRIFDKRETIKKREESRAMHRALKKY